MCPLSDPRSDDEAGADGGRKRPQVTLFHPGTQHSPQLARQLHRRRLLHEYITSVFYRPYAWPYSAVRSLPWGFRVPIERELNRRRIDGLDGAPIREVHGLEWIRAVCARMRAPHRLRSLLFEAHTAMFDRATARRIVRSSGDVVWGTPDCPVALAAAKAIGRYVVVDQAIGHHAALVRTLAAARAERPHEFGGEFEGSSAFHLSRERSSHAIADSIVVGSAFAAQTLVDEGVPEAKVKIIRYGYDEQLFPGEFPIRRPTEGRPLEFIFVGRVGGRKGVYPLVKAFSQIHPSDAHLNIIGPMDLPNEPNWPPTITYLGRLPKAQVIKHFLNADCFILASLFEGSALVLNEAIGSGLGIIQTKSSGDGVVEGRNGFILEDSSVEQLSSAIKLLLSNRSLVTDWQHASWRMREEYTWSRYGDRVDRFLMDVSQ